MSISRRLQNDFFLKKEDLLVLLKNKETISSIGKMILSLEILEILYNIILALPLFVLIERNWENPIKS